MDQSVRLAMLHASLKYDNVAHNLELLAALCVKALDLAPDIIVMPELAVSGYEFFKEIGSDWIKEVVPPAVDRFCRLARESKTAIILGSPRFSEKTNLYHNAAIFIDEQGRVAGEHYKINVLPGSEGWASPGVKLTPVAWREHKIGLLICSDAYTGNIAGELARQGANVLISPAAWAPGFHGPDGEWELRSKETGLCLFVCNRTGMEKNMNFSGGSSVAVAAGRRLFEYAHQQPAILAVEVSSRDWLPLSRQFDILEVSENGTPKDDGGTAGAS